MTDLRVLLALAALCAVALFYISLGIKGALAPFCAVCTAAVWFSAFGVFGALTLGGWLFYALAVAAAVFVIVRHGVGRRPLGFLGFGFWFFVGASLVVLLLLYWKQPLFTYFDEFTLWGTAGKLTKVSGELYTTAPIGWLANSTQKPAMILFGYFFQFFGKDFVEWQTYAANDVFLLAALSTVLCGFEKKRDWSGALPAMLVLVLLPFAFRHGIAVHLISNVYLDSTVDMQLGAAFGAVMVLWFAGKGKPLKRVAPVMLGLFTLVLIKDAALVLALVAVLIIFADCLFAKRETGLSRGRKTAWSFAVFGLCLLAVLASFFLWESYASYLSGINRLADSGGSTSAGMLQLPFLFLQDLFSPQKSVLFATVTSKMIAYFFARSTMFGSGFTAMVVVVGVAGAAALLAGKKSALRRQCVVFAVAAAVGFLGYFFFMMCSYLYLFAESEAMVLASYDRYFFPVYLALFMVAMFLFCKSAARAAVRKGAVAKLGLVALGLVLLTVTYLWLPVNYTLLGVQPEDYNTRREFDAHVEELQAHLSPDDKVFLMMSFDADQRLFMYVHSLLPYQADYSYGGGEQLLKKVRAPGSAPQIVEITKEELARHLVETGCTVVYIDSLNEHFRTMYADLFADGLAAYDNGETSLYEVQVDPDGQVTLVPVPGGPL